MTTDAAIIVRPAYDIEDPETLPIFGVTVCGFFQPGIIVTLGIVAIDDETSGNIHEGETVIGSISGTLKEAPDYLTTGALFIETSQKTKSGPVWEPCMGLRVS